MPTIPTGKLERELRAQYLRFVQGLSFDDGDLTTRVARFQASSEALIAREGGRVALLGALGDFPAPKLIPLSPTVGVVYDQMRQAAVQAGIVAGVSSKDAARQMFRAGMDKSYRRLERFARTETTNAYWKNAFDSVADLPALVMLWGSEDGPRTCPWCRERDGMVIDGSDVRDHPNGRCTPIPTLRSQVEYRGSVRRDGSIYFDPNWNKAPYQKLPTDIDINVGEDSFSEATFRTGANSSWDNIASSANPAINGVVPNQNCVNVSIVTELRKRGYEVTPSPSLFTPKTSENQAFYTIAKLNRELATGVNKARITSTDLAMRGWRTPDGKVRIPYSASKATPGVSGGVNGATLALFKNTMPEGARGFAVGAWSGPARGGVAGHMWNWEVRGGEVHFFDAQLGQGFVPIRDYLSQMKPGSLQMVRVDDLTPVSAVKEVLK